MIPFTQEQLDEQYGQRVIEVGKAFRTKDKIHYYLQREDDVLHISHHQLINTLHVGFLNDMKGKGYKEVTLEVFEANIKEIIYMLELDKYWSL